jgi:DNA-directed RNA polymerase specialized sigma24 family protein
VKPTFAEQGSPERTPTEDLFRRYAAELKIMLRWYRVPGSEREDALQEALEETFKDHSTIATDQRGIKVALLDLAARVAQRVRRRWARRWRRQTTEEAERLDPHDAALRVELFLAIDALEEPLRGAVIRHAIFGYTYEEIAQATGQTVDTVQSWLKRGRALIIASEHKETRRGLVIPIGAGLGLGLTPLEKAAFAALLAVEGRAPQFGGPGGPPRPPPPPPPPPVGRPVLRLPSNVAPWAAVGTGLLAVAVAIVALVFALRRPASEGAAARAGLHVPPCPAPAPSEGPSPAAVSKEERREAPAIRKAGPVTLDRGELAPPQDELDDREKAKRLLSGLPLNTRHERVRTPGK